MSKDRCITGNAMEAWILLFMLGVSMMAVQEVPYGVPVQQQGQARAFTTAMEVVVIMRHPKATMSRPLQRLQSTLGSCLTSCMPWVMALRGYIGNGYGDWEG